MAGSTGRCHREAGSGVGWRSCGKDGDGNYLATCRAREPQARGTVLNVVGRVMSITVLKEAALEQGGDDRVQRVMDHPVAKGGADTGADISRRYGSVTSIST